MRIKQLSVDEIKLTAKKKPVRPSGTGGGIGGWLKHKAQSEDRLDTVLPPVSPGASRRAPTESRTNGDQMLHRSKSSHNAAVVPREPSHHHNQLVRALNRWFHPTHDQQRRATISPLSEKLVFIQNNRGELQYFLRRRWVIDGKEVEQWREMDPDTGHLIVRDDGDAPVQQQHRAQTTPNQLQQSTSQELVRRSQKQLPAPPPTTADRPQSVVNGGTKFNLLGMQNVAINVTVHDLFGLGYFSMAIQKLYQLHREFLDRQSAVVRHAILFWELLAVTLVLWQVVRVLSLLELVVGLASRAVSDGLDIVEMGVGGIFLVFRRAGELLGMVPARPVAANNQNDDSVFWKFSRHIW